MYSRPATPNDARSLRPNIQAVPETSSMMEWQPWEEAWMEDILMLDNERRMWGSARSGLLRGREEFDV